MAVQIRAATADDSSVVAALLHATDVHYWGDAAPAPADYDRMVRDRVLAPGSGWEMVLAELDGRAVGYVTFVVLYPAPDLGAALYMKELFVLAEARSAGVGESLMQHVAGIALDRGCVRFDWSAESENAGALRFYDRIGGVRQTNKVYYRVDGAALRTLAGSEEVTAAAGDAKTAP